MHRKLSKLPNRLIEFWIASVGRPHDGLAVLYINTEAGRLFPHAGYGQLYLFINVSLEKSSAISGIEPLFGKQIYSRLADLYGFALTLHLSSQSIEKIGRASCRERV